jgi:hypothetical protein
MRAKEQNYKQNKISIYCYLCGREYRIYHSGFKPADFHFITRNAYKNLEINRR